VHPRKRVFHPEPHRPACTAGNSERDIRACQPAAARRQRAGLLFPAQTAGSAAAGAHRTGPVGAAARDTRRSGACAALSP